MQRATFPQRDAHKATPRGFVRLADCLGHLTRLAMTEADAALEVTHNDQRCKAEALTALHNLGDAIDVHQLVGKLAFALLAVAAAVFSRKTCHGSLSFRQNCRPPSRAASASAFTRPWY